MRALRMMVLLLMAVALPPACEPYDGAEPVTEKEVLAPPANILAFLGEHGLDVRLVEHPAPPDDMDGAQADYTVRVPRVVHTGYSRAYVEGVPAVVEYGYPGIDHYTTFKLKPATDNKRRRGQKRSGRLWHIDATMSEPFWFYPTAGGGYQFGRPSEPDEANTNEPGLLTDLVAAYPDNFVDFPGTHDYRVVCNAMNLRPLLADGMSVTIIYLATFGDAITTSGGSARPRTTYEQWNGDGTTTPMEIVWLSC